MCGYEHVVFFKSLIGCSYMLGNEILTYVLICQDYLQTCLTQIEEMVSSALKTSSKIPSGDRSKVDETEKQTEQHNKAGTPTDIRDIHFWHSRPP